MLNNNIEVGDLVQVIKPCPWCGDSSEIGVILLVGEIVLNEDGDMSCCGDETPTITAFPPGEDSGFPIVMLKKIPPIEDLEGAEDSRDLKVPVKGKELEKV